MLSCVGVAHEGSLLKDVNYPASLSRRFFFVALFPSLLSLCAFFFAKKKDFYKLDELVHPVTAY